MDINIEFANECPFYYEEEWSYSEYTRGTSGMCKKLRKECDGLCCGNCPLKEGESLVFRIKKEDLLTFEGEKKGKSDV